MQFSGITGLDSLRAREAYFSLAERWGGEALGELAGAPILGEDGVLHFATGAPVVSPGSLVRLSGSMLAPQLDSALSTDLPLNLQGVSACLGGEPVSLLHAEPTEIRGQASWSLQPGRAKAAAVRQGLTSNIVEVEVAPSAPGIFDGGVARAGLPCPANLANGVPPGSHLAVFGTGLGQTETEVGSGLAAQSVAPPRELPRVWLGDREIPVVFSGLLPQFVGVFQTNVFIPADYPAVAADLRLTQSGVSSNPYPLRVVGAQQPAAFDFSPPEPAAVVLQQGGPTQTAYVRISGVNSFCDTVTFAFSGLPAGVRASAPEGFPGHTVPLWFQADVGAVLAQETAVSVIAQSSLPDSVQRIVRLTVLPSLGTVRLRVVSGGWLSKAPMARFELDDRVLYEVMGGGPGRGFNFFTIDSATGTVGTFHTFDTWASEQQVAAMEDYLRSLPDGVLAMGAIADDGSLLLTDQTRRIVHETLGSGMIDFVGYQYSWAIIARKGAEAPIAERLHPAGVVVLDEMVTFPLE